VHVDEGADLGRRILGQVVPDRLQLLVHGDDGVLQAKDFCLDLFFVDQVMLDVERGWGEKMRPPDGDAARYCDAV